MTDYEELKRSLEAIHKDGQDAKVHLLANRKTAEAVDKKIDRFEAKLDVHQETTVVNSEKIATTQRDVAAIKEGMSSLKERVIEIAVTGEDTRTALSKAQNEINETRASVIRHDEQISGRYRIPTMLAGLSAAVLLFLGYYVDSEATNNTIQTIKEFF